MAFVLVNCRVRVAPVSAFTSRGTSVAVAGVGRSAERTDSMSRRLCVETVTKLDDLVAFLSALPIGKFVGGGSQYRILSEERIDRLLEFDAGVGMNCRQLGLEIPAPHPALLTGRNAPNVTPYLLICYKIRRGGWLIVYDDEWQVRLRSLRIAIESRFALESHDRDNDTGNLKPKINERMLSVLQNNKDAAGWTAREWGAEHGYTLLESPYRVIRIPRGAGSGEDGKAGCSWDLAYAISFKRTN